MPRARSPGPGGGERGVFALLVGLHLLAIWSVRFFPSQDGPIHLEIAAVLRDLLSGTPSILGRYFELNPHWAQPNWMVYPPLIALSALMPARTAEKLLLSGYVILFPLALRYALGQVRSEGTYLAFFGFPLVLGYLLHMGFYNFSFGLVAYLATVGYWFGHRRRLTARSTAAFAGLLLLAFFCHLLAWAMVGATAAAVLAWEFFVAPPAGEIRSGTRRTARRQVLLHRALPTLLAALPEIVLAAQFLRQEEGEPPQRLPLVALVKQLALGHSLVSFSRWELIFSVALMAALAAAVGAAGWRRFRRRERSPADGLLAAAAVVLALYFALPVGLLGGGYLNQRLQLFLLLLVIAWLAGQPALDRWRRPALALGVTIAVGFLALHVASYRRLDRDFGEYFSVTRWLEPETTLLSLSYANFGIPGADGRPPSWKVRPFDHASARLAVERQVAACDGVAATVTATVVAAAARATARPATKERLVGIGNLLARATGDCRPGGAAVLHDRHAPVVAAAVGRGDKGLGVGIGRVDVPGRTDLFRGRHIRGHLPVAGAGDRDVEVVPVVHDCPGGERRGAAAATCAAAAASAAAAPPSVMLELPLLW